RRRGSAHSRCGAAAARGSLRESPLQAPPATTDGPVPSRSPAPEDRSESPGGCSFPSSCEPIQQVPDRTQLLGTRLSSGQRLQHEFGGGSTEGAVGEIAEELSLGLLLAVAGLVNMGPFRFVANHQTLLGHDL